MLSVVEKKSKTALFISATHGLRVGQQKHTTMFTTERGGLHSGLLKKAVINIKILNAYFSKVLQYSVRTLVNNVNKILPSLLHGSARANTFVNCYDFNPSSNPVLRIDTTFRGAALLYFFDYYL